MDQDILTAALAAFLKRSRGAIQFTDAEMEAARAEIANGARVLVTVTTQFGDGRRTTYRIELVREGL